MGIGGLDNEFSTIFRRAFASRIFPPVGTSSRVAPFTSPLSHPGPQFSRSTCALGLL